MTHMQRHDPDILVDLLADLVTVGLSEEDHLALNEMLAGRADASLEEFEHAAAALARAFSAVPDEPLPDHLRRRILTDGRAWLDAAHESVDAIPLHPADASVLVPRPTVRARSPQRARGRVTPWLVAAACLLIAGVSWWRGPQAPGVGPVSPTPDATALVDRASDHVVTTWNDNDLGVRGEVHWSSSLQQGYLTFTGLPANDPSSVQYQLWIFDAQRNPAFNAVDGGVFDIAAGDSGRATVPFASKLDVFEPVLFAVTTEPPGGVVKHDATVDPERYRIILTAAPPGVG